MQWDLEYCALCIYQVHGFDQFAASIDAARAKCAVPGFGQAFEGIAQILMAGTDSVLHAMELYTKRAWVLRAWQDVFVDLVQGQLQQLFLSLLSREPLPVHDGMRETNEPLCE